MSNKKFECQRDYKICNEHFDWLNTIRIDVKSLFFELFDKNMSLKETIEILESEINYSNVELGRYKLINQS